MHEEPSTESLKSQAPLHSNKLLKKFSRSVPRSICQEDALSFYDTLTRKLNCHGTGAEQVACLRALPHEAQAVCFSCPKGLLLFWGTYRKGKERKGSNLQRKNSEA